MNKTDGSIVGCDIELKNGRTCGIPPIGRCATCERAFCLTHQACRWDNYGRVPYVDMCAPCFAKTPEQVALAEQAKRRAEVDAAEQYFRSKAARAALLSSGLPPVEIYQVKRHWEWKRKGILLREVREQVEVATPIGRGWILGTFKWAYRDTPQRKDLYGVQVYDAPCLTALLDAYRDASLKSSLSFDSWSLLGRVSPYSRGYEALGAGDLQNDWIAAMQAVKRLAGASS